METGVILLFVIAISMHNLEEAVWLPKWFAKAGKYKRELSQNEFIFAVVIITILAYSAAFLYMVFPQSMIVTSFYFGFCGAMILNLFMHLIPTIQLRKYAPGLITSLFVVCPTNAYIIMTAIRLGLVTIMQFLLSTFIIGLLLLALLPLLFKVGKSVTREF